MEAPVPIAVALEIGERIATPYHHVADVELVADDGRVGARHEHVVGHRAVDRRHVVRLVVEGEPDAGAARGGPGGGRSRGSAATRRTAKSARCAPRARAILPDRGPRAPARWYGRSYRRTRAARRRYSPWRAPRPGSARDPGASRRAPNRARARYGRGGPVGPGGGIPTAR